MRSAPTASALSTNRSSLTSAPRSKTSKPLAWSIEATRFLPMSWMSPSTVPMTTLPPIRASMFAWLEFGLEDGHGRLHGFGAGDELGQEIFALLPELADLLDARHIALFDDLREVQPGRHGLGGEAGGRLAVAGHDGLVHLGEELRLVHEVTPCR